MGSTEKVKAILSEYLVLVIAFIVLLTLLKDNYLNKKMSPAISAIVNCLDHETFGARMTAAKYSPSFQISWT